MARLVLRVDPGTPMRLEEDCPSCGWADLWQVAMLLIRTDGVMTLAVATRCARCDYNPSTGKVWDR